MESRCSEPEVGPFRQFVRLYLRIQLSLTFFWFGACEHRVVIVPNRSTLTPGLAWFDNSTGRSTDRVKNLFLSSVPAMVRRRLGTQDVLALTPDEGDGGAPLGQSRHATFSSGGRTPVDRPREIVFISPEIVTLVPGEELAGARVVVLEPGRDAVGQIGTALEAHPGAEVVRLISHGEPGALLVAGQRVTRDVLRTHAEEIATWRRHLAPGADILLYGCSVAATAEGRLFVDSISALTGVDVAASTNLTGAASLGGDLTLEYALCSIEGRVGRFVQAWDHSGLVLPAPSFSSAPTANFTTGVPGSFTVTASGSPTYSIAPKTFFESNFAALPGDWATAGSAEVTGGACVLTPATASTNGALILPKLGAASPGSFTASFDYTIADGTAGTTFSGLSFNYGVITTTTGSVAGMLGNNTGNGLSVCFFEAGTPGAAIVEVRCNGLQTPFARGIINFGSGTKPVQIKLDGASILTVSYDGKTVVSLNMAGMVETADRSNWQFALGASNTTTNPNRHTIDNLAIVSNGTLPAGLTLAAATGVISGTPTTANAAGTQVFEVVATNADGTARQQFALNVASGAPVVTSSATPPILPGVSFSHTVVAPGTAGPTTYSVALQTLLSTTLANSGTLPEGAFISGSARFNSGALELTQNAVSQTGWVQFPGRGTQNPTAFSASFNMKMGGGTTVGGAATYFNYGAPGLNTRGLRLEILDSGDGVTNNTLKLTLNYNGALVATANTPNPFTSALYNSNTFLPIRLVMSGEGRLQVWVNNILAYDAGNITGWSTLDKSLWAFGLSATTGNPNTNFHTIKDLVISTNGVLPPGLALDTATGVISGKIGLGTSVDEYVNVTATNAAGVTMQLLQLDITPSNTLPGQRPATGTSLGGANSLGATGEQFRNLSAFAALTSDGTIKVWGNTANGGSRAPTGTGYVAITSNEKAFAALRNDGTIASWGLAANGGTGAPTGTGYQQISATRSAFAAIKTDGSIVAWGNTANGGAFNASSTSSPTGTGYARVYANGGGFVAQKFDGTVRAWGHTNSIGASTPPTTPFIPRFAANDFGSGTNTYGAFAGLNNSGAIKVWGSSTTGGTKGAPIAPGQQDIVATSRAFAAIDISGGIKVWGDSLFGGTGAPTDSGYRQIYGNNAAFVAVRQDGSLAAWGSSLNGGSGAPTGTGYVQVFSTLNAFAALKADGSISVWGSSLDGLITRAPSGTGYVSLFSTSSAFAALKADGSVTVWGNTSEGGTNGPTGTGWSEITSSVTAFVARRNDGTLYAWGSSANGGTGVPAGNFVTVQSPTLAKPYFPQAAGAPVNLVVNQNQTSQVLTGVRGHGLVYTVASGRLPAGLQLDPVNGWLYGSPAEPGYFPLTIEATSAAGSVTRSFTLKVESSLLPNQRQGTGAVYTIGSGTEIPSAGAFAGLTADGRIYVWGISSIGGSGAPTGTGYTKLTANNNAYAALRYDGSITAWGDSRYGGSGAPTGSGFTAIYSTNQAFAALKADGSIVAWGNSLQGGSGAPTGTGYTRIYASVFSFAALKADGSITVWGDSTYLSGNTPTGTGYVSLVPNANAYAALKADGSITAWGLTTGGGAGAPTGTGYTKVFASQNAYATLRNDGSIAVWGSSSTGGASGPSGTGFVDLWSSANGFAALKADGSLTSWGASGTFNSSTTPTGTGYTQVFSTGGAFAALKADGGIVSWGATDSGGTGAPTGTGYTTVFSNNNAFVALKADGSLTAWGNASFGGTGAPTGTGYTQVFSRKYAFAAMKADGTVSVWGNIIFGGTGASGQVEFAAIQNATAVIPSRQDDTTGNLPAARVGTSVATMTAGLNSWAGFQVGANGVGVGSAVTSGSLPNGLTLNTATGRLEGTPIAMGSATFTVTSYNGTGQSSQTYTLVVQTASSTTAAPYFDPTKPFGYPNYAVGKSVSYDLSAVATPSTSASQVNYSVVAGALPPGMVLQVAGRVAGTPTTPGRYWFLLAASDARGVATQDFIILVSDGTLPNQRPGQYAPIEAGSSGSQGLNEAAFAALRPDGTIVTWGDSTYGGSGAANVPTEAGYVQIAQTKRAFAALRYDGSIKAWGDTSFGGAGAPTDQRYTQLFSNGAAFAALAADGRIVSWGDGAAGGTGAPTGTGYTQVFSNAQAFVAMKADGSLTGWGNTATGASGVPSGTGYVTITSNSTAFAALKSDGSIVAWGNTANGGQLPALATNNSFLALYSNSTGFAALRADGTIATWGATVAGDKAFPGGNNFVSVSGTDSAFAALKSDGTIVTWGATNKGGTNGPTGTGFTAIYSTQSAFAALRRDGSIVSWGSTTAGSTGAPAGTGYTQIYANALAFTALRNDGTVRSWGNAGSGGTGKSPTTTGFVQVFSTLSAFVGQKTDGSFVAWGSTSNGGAGAPVSTGFSVSSALAMIPYQQPTTTGELPTAYLGTAIGLDGGSGPNGYQVGGISQGASYQVTAGALPGGLTLDPRTGFISGTPTVAGTYAFTITSTSAAGLVSQAYTLEVKEPLAVLAPNQRVGSGAIFAAGTGQSIGNYGAYVALKADGSIVAWGNPSFGGSGAPTGAGFTQVFSNDRAFAALKADGSIVAWGNSSSGGSGAPTGTGFTQVFSTPLAFAALKSDGSIRVWGDVASGGSGAPTGTGFTQVFSNGGAFSGLKADGSIVSWGDTDKGGIGAPTGTGFTRVFASGAAFVALRADGSVASWGSSLHGGSGAPTGTGYAQIFSTGYAFAGLKADGSITAWGNSASGGFGAPTATGYAQVFSTTTAFAALKGNGSVTAWGNTTAGGAGAPTATGYTQVASSSSAFAALKADGSITAWGSVYTGGSGAPTGTGFTRIFSNEGAFAALTADGSITAWGNTDKGGNGAPTGTGFVRVFSNTSSFTALRADGSIVSWGNSANGGANAPAGSFATVQSPSASDPVFARFPVSSALTTESSQPFFANLGAQGVGVRYEIAVGTLPPGLTLDANTGVVSGTATSAGTYFFTLAASTPLGTATQAFTIQVPADQAVAFTSLAGATFTVGASGTFTVAASGSPTFSVVQGTLPSGLSLNANTGVLSGTAAAGTGGVYDLTIRATNPAGSVDQSFKLTVNQAPSITSASAVTFAINTPDSFEVTIAPGTYPAATFSTNGSLPTGVTLSSAGLLSGTPTQAGTSGFTIVASNGVGFGASQPFALTVSNVAPPTLSSVAIASNNANPAWAKVGDTVTVTFTAGEAIRTPVVTIAGRPAVVASAASNTYTATVTLAAGDPEGPVAFSIEFTGQSGVKGIAASATTNNSAVTFDATAPTLTSVVIASTNAQPAVARPGDTVTVTFTSSEPIGTPTATIAGRAATIANSSGNTYTASVTMVLGDTSGLVAFSVGFSDRAGNTGTAVTDSTDNSDVSFGENPPIVTVTGVVTTLAGSGTAGGVDATGAAASFNLPAGVAVDGEGTTHVADSVNHRIRKITLGGVVTTFAGSGTAGGGDGAGAAASFNTPSGVALGADGTLYVADTANHKIRKITPAGVVSTLAGSGTAGGADATGAAASFSSPSAVAVAADGTVYVADRGNHKIRAITAGGVVSTLAGSGAAGSADGAGAAASFNTPSAVALAADGTVYVADSANHKIRRITAAGVVTTLAGTGEAGRLDGAGSSATFSTPYGIAVGSDGVVYVADRGNNRIRLVTAAGAVSTLAGSGTTGSADGTGLAANFNAPLGLAVGVDGSVYVADNTNHKVRKITTGTLTDAVLTVSSAAVTSGASVTLTATIKPQTTAGGAGTPAGSVLFKRGATTLGTVALNGSGVATLAVNSADLAEGISGFTVLYPGRSGGALPGFVASASPEVNVTVNRAPTLPATVAGTSFAVGRAGSIQLEFTGFPVPAITTTSTLPAGVTLSGGGVLSGTPAAGSGGSYPLLISASNGIGGTVSRSFTLVVNSAPVFTGSTVVNAVALAPVSAKFSSVGFPVETNANIFTNDFSAGTLPTGWSLAGTASLTGGVLQLTPAANNSRGIVTLPAVGAASPAGFSARFKLIVGNAGGADGVSFNYGTLLTGTALDSTADLEAGMVSGGLVVSFAESGDDRMEVRYNNRILSSVYLPFANVAGAAVDITVTPLGLLTLTLDGAPITTVNLGDAYVAAPKSAWQFAFAARTSTSNSQHAIDDLAIYALQIAYGTTSNYVDSTFGSALPAGWALYGDAVLDAANNQVVLTPSANGKNGALVLPALGAASPGAFSAQFDYRAAGGTGADGISFNYGLIPASPSGTEAGFVSPGLVVQFIEYQTDRIIIAYDGTTLATGNVTLEDPYRRVSIDVGADRSVAVSVNGTVAVTATLPAGYDTAAKSAWQFGFGSRTGSFNNEHSIRNLSIALPRVLPAGLTLNPVTGVLSGTITNPASADIPVTIVATNASGATVREVTISNRPFSTLSPVFAAASDVGISRSGFTETGVTLGAITLGFAPRPGQKLTLLKNTGGAASTGRFTGLAEGATVTAVYNGDTFTFILSYADGTGNDVTLTRVLGAGQTAGSANVTTLAGAGTSGGADGTGVAASFNAPYGVAVGGDGTVYVADYSNNKIRKITPAGVVTTLAGSGTAGGADGTGTAASFNKPYGIAVGTDGTVYVADYSNNKIRKITPAGVVTTLAGSGTAGGGEGNGAAASFNGPAGVTVDADGVVYVADYGNNRIRRITPAGEVTTFAGSGTAGSANGTGAAASFNGPSAITLGVDGSLYVADLSGNTIRKITSAGVVSTLAGSGTAGGVDGNGAAASFNAPSSVAVGTDGVVYVADFTNNKIRRIAPDGTVTTLAGAGTAGGADGTAGTATFSAPQGVAVGLDGTVFVADRANNTIRKITSADAQPIITSTGVTGITANGATINGTVNPNGFITTAVVEYGPTASLGQTAAISLSPNNGTTVQTVSATLAELTTGITYNYRLRATNVDGSVVTTSGTFKPVAPAKPTLAGASSSNVTATALTFGGNVSSDGGATITERGIKYRVAGSTGAYTKATASGTTGAFTVNVTGLSGATTYQFYAYAVNSIGEGRSSDEGSVTTPAAATVAEAPTAPTATVSGTSAVVSFTPGSNGGAAITNYEYSLDNGVTWVAMNPAAVTSPLTLTGLTPGTTYQLKLRAVNSVGTGAASAAVTVAVSAALAITSATSASGTYGTAFSYDVTASGGPTLFGATGLPTGLSIDTGTGKITGVPTQTGTFVVDLTISTSAGSAKRALEIVVAKKALTVTAEAKTRVYGQDDPAFTAVLSGFVPGETAAVVSGSPKFSVAATASSPAGTYAITPSLGSLTATNYSFGTFVPANLTVTAQAATVAIGDLAPTYNGSARAVKVTTSPASLAVSLSYVGTGTTSYAASSTAPTNAGTYAVTATITDTNYSGTKTETLVIAKASQTITIAPLPTSVALNTLSTVNISASASSGLLVSLSLASDSAAGVGLNASGGTTSLTSLNGSTGTVKVIATQAGNANYDAATSASANFEVTKANQKISFTGPVDQAFNAASPTVALVASTDATGLTVSFSVVSGPATVSGSTLTLSGSGKVVVRASQAGDTSYNAAPDVDQSFNVGRATQSVNFAALNNATYGDPAIALGATTSPAGRPVTFELVSGPATLVGNQLTLTGAGVVTVRASQPGDDTYEAATPVTRSFTVAPKALTVSGAVAQNKTYDGTNAAVITGATLDGVVTGDTVSLGGTGAGTFAQAGAGDGIAVTTAMTLVGASAAKYTLTQPTGLTANIAKKSLNVGGVTVADKVYDGLLGATANYSAASFVGLVGSDSVTLNSANATASFADKNAGTGKPVTIAGLALASGGASANYTLVQPTATGQILRKALTVSGATATGRAYDGTRSATVNFGSATLAGKVGNDAVSLVSTGATALFDDSKVGVDRSVQVAGLTLTGADSGNYNLGQPTLTASITPLALTVTGVTAADKVFDKATTATINASSAALTGVLSADVAGVTLDRSSVTGEFASAEVGTNKVVTLVGFTLTGSAAANYTVTQPTTTASITTAALTVQGIAGVNRAYNGTRTASISTAQATLVGVAVGSGVSLDASNVTALFDTPAVGTSKSVQVSGLALTGPHAANYTLTQPSTTANITPAPISISGVTVKNKVYDGSLTGEAVYSAAQPTGVLTGESVTLVTTNATATFASKAVGQGIAVTLAGITLGGTHAANYTVTPPTLSADITRKALTVAGITVENRVYDATSVVTHSFANAALQGVVSGDTVTLESTGATAALADASAGANKAVVITGLSLGGASSGNYSLTAPSVTVDIAAKALTVAGVTVHNKVYDGTVTANANVANATLEGILQGDAVSLVTSAVTASFASKDVGAEKAVTITGLSLSGGSAANYTITPPAVSADITPRALTASGVTALSRMFDATTEAVVNAGSAVLAGVLTGDAVILEKAKAIGAFADIAVGTGKNVVVYGLELSGADAANYTVTPPTATADITAKAVQVLGATALDRTYDGTTVAALDTSAMTLDGLVSGDTVTLVKTGATGAFANKAAGNNKVVQISGLTLAGENAASYTLIQPTATASITPKTLALDGVSVAPKVYDGTTSAAPNFANASLVGVVDGDQVAPVSTSASASFSSKTAGAGKAVGFTGITLSGADAGNYSLTQPTINAEITAKALSVTGVTAANKVYDRSVNATPSFTNLALVGVVSGDQVTPVTTGATATFDTDTFGTGKTVTIAGLSLSGADAPNYTVTPPTTKADITAKALTISGVTGVNRTYDGTTVAALNTASAALVGVIGIDAVTLVKTGAAGVFASKTVGSAKPVQISGFALSGSDAGNYALTQPATTASVTAAVLTVNGVKAASKVYDGTTKAVPNFGAVVLVGVVTGDVVNPDSTAATASFASKIVETGKNVSIAGLALSGADAGNYIVTQPTTTADITVAPLTVTGIMAASRVYDATTVAALTTTSAALVGVVSGDAVTLVKTDAAGAFASKTVGTAKAVQISGLTLAGGDAANYALTQPTTTADITAKGLTISGAKVLDKIYDGSVEAGLDFAAASLVGVISGDGVSLVTTAAKGAFADPNAGGEKPVAITGLSLSGTDAANYALTAPSPLAAISQRPVTFTIGTPAFVYDGSPKPVAVSVSQSVPFAVTYAEGGRSLSSPPTNVGSYSVSVSVADRNYAGTASGTLVISKAPQTLTVKAPATATLLEPVPVSAISSSGLPVSLEVSGPATLVQGALRFSAPGTAVITASQAGNANYSAATVTATVTVTGKLQQAIAFAAPGDRLSNSGPLTLSATATSGLPVTFSVVSGPALIAGNVVTLRGDAGRVIVRASQAGDARFEAATDVTISFQVTAATVNVYFGNVTSATQSGAAPKVGDIAAALPPNSNQGSLLVVAPAVGLNRALDFQLNPDGTFEQTFIIDGPATGGLDTPPVAAAPVTVKVKGRLLNGRLSGTVEPLGLTFDAPVQPVVGTSANAAGFYRSSTLANTAGATYSIVGTNNQVLVLATTPAVTTGGLTTLGSDGTFALQTTTTAGAATIRGTVDEPTTTVAGSISIAGTTTQFAGLVTTTTRTDRLINLSSRVRISGGDSVLITGFVIGGTAPKQVLIRGIGPALTGFGVGGALANPKLKIYRGSTLVSENDDWSADTAASFPRVGAFGLAAGSRDAALLVTLEPGAYTAHVSDGGAAGVALAEIYDASLNPTAEYQRLINISTRGEVTAGEGVLIGGFVVTGNSPKRLLIRGVGPGLAAFGVGGVLADPRLRVYRNADLQAENDNWSAVAAEGTAAADAAREAGAFALVAGSRDSALIVTLAPGAYTAQITSADGTATGSALIEIYELP